MIENLKTIFKVYNRYNYKSFNLSILIRLIINTITVWQFPCKCKTLTNFLFLSMVMAIDLNFTEGQVVVGLSDDHMSSYLSTAMDILETLSSKTYYSTKARSSINSSSIDSLSAAISSVPDTNASNMVRSAKVYSPPVVGSFVVSGVGARVVSIMSRSFSIYSSSRLTTPSLRSRFCWPFTREKLGICHQQNS